MVTIKDIALKCGLSIASVSKALSGKATDINPKTIEYIKSVAKEMGYIPNSSARVLKTNHSYSIGVLFEDKTQSGIQHEYFSVILSAIKDGCEAYGYDITFISHHKGIHNLTYYEHTRFRNCDGVIIANADFTNPEISYLVDSDIPCVTIDYHFENRSSVVSDNSQGMHDIIEYVSSMGHKRIAFIHGELTSVTQKRVRSFYHACHEYGIEIREDMIKEGRYHVPRVSAIATKELLNMPNPPTCIIFPDDYSLLGGMTVITKRGLKIPDDISVVGYDGILLSRLMRPEFTTYVQNAKEIGIRASKKVIELIENPETSKPEIITVKGYLQKGSTVKDLNKIEG